MIDGDHDSKPDAGHSEHPDSIRAKLDVMTAEMDALKSIMVEAACEYEEQIVALKAEVDRLSYAGQNAIVKHDEEVAQLRKELSTCHVYAKQIRESRDAEIARLLEPLKRLEIATRCPDGGRMHTTEAENLLEELFALLPT